jgi:hypothetical protein
MVHSDDLGEMPETCEHGIPLDEDCEQCDDEDDEWNDDDDEWEEWDGTEPTEQPGIE